MISIVPFFAFGFLLYIFFGFWVILYGIWKDTGDDRYNGRLPFVVRIFMELLFIICGNTFILIGGVVVSIIGIFFMEIMGFSILAFIVWAWCIDTRWSIKKKNDSM